MTRIDEGEAGANLPPLLTKPTFTGGTRVMADFQHLLSAMEQQTLFDLVPHGKKCTKCGQFKSLENFRAGRKKGRFRSWCKTCDSEATARWAKRCPARSAKNTRDHGLRKKQLGLPVDWYEKTLLAQQGLCAICKRPEVSQRAGRVRSLAIDHNHKTGKVRGLLCQKCNLALGNFQDSSDVLLSAIAYLRAHQQINDS